MDAESSEQESQPSYFPIFAKRGVPAPWAHAEGW